MAIPFSHGGDVAFFVVYEEQTGRRGRAIPGVYVANAAFKTREEAEGKQREIADRAANAGTPAPEFRIVEASTVQAALVEAGSPIPPRVC
jgi:hypothetical protein